MRRFHLPLRRRRASYVDVLAPRCTRRRLPRHRRAALRAGAAALLCSCAAALAPLAVIAGAGLELKVGADQSVSLTGSSESLRAVVERLCDEARIELRGYDAPDRTFAGSYRGVPATALLPRLLREESHAIGLRGESGGSARIAWLRVLGEPGARSAAPSVQVVSSMEPEAETGAVAETPAQAFDADKHRVLDLLLPALESRGAEREAAVQEIVDTLANEPESREPFLGATQTDVAHAIAEFPDARQVLAAIGLEIRDAEAQRNFRHIVQQVNLALQSGSRAR